MQRELIAGLGNADADALVTQPSNLEPGVTAGIDPTKGTCIKIDIEREPVIAAAPAHTQANRGDLRWADVDARRIGARLRWHAVLGQEIDHRLLEQVHQLLDAEARAFEIQQEIGDQLAGPMVGHLAAAIALNDGDLAGIQDMLRQAGLAKGEHRWMLEQPKLVVRFSISRIAKLSHARPGLAVVTTTEPMHAQCR